MMSRPFSRCRMARRRMYGSASDSIRMAVMHPGVDADLLEDVLEGEGVDDGGQHAHVVRGDAVHALAGWRWPRA